MNKPWLLTIIGVSFFLLATLKAFEIKSLKTYYQSERIIRLTSFEKARSKVKGKDLEHLKLWESMLTGRSAPLSRFMKERYQTLGLNHLFTPSGFHLSAAVFPFIKLLNSKYHLLVMILLGSFFWFLPGLTALKRMLLIKTNQKLLGMQLGFVIGLIMDMLFGSFQSGALSFAYSFLFLGIIYSGLRGIGLIFWFFLAQMILAYFQNADMSLLLLLFSPILNLGFGILMPVLFLLSIPLWDWQLHTGIYLLNILQSLVDMSSKIVFSLPLIEVQIVTLLIAALFLYQRKIPLFVLLFIFSSSLNLDREKIPGPSTNEFVPQGRILKTMYNEKFVSVVYEDGSCKVRLVRGFWYENCSPKRRSSHKRQFKKLSYPS